MVGKVIVASRLKKPRPEIRVEDDMGKVHDDLADGDTTVEGQACGFTKQSDQTEHSK